MPPHSRRPSRLTAQDIGRLADLLAHGPRAAGHGDDRWTVERVADLMAFHFGVFYIEKSVHRVLRTLGYTYEGRGWRGQWVRARE